MILTVNAGSSSLKVGLYHEPEFTPVLHAQSDRLNEPDTHWKIAHASGLSDSLPVTRGGSMADALERFVGWLGDAGYRESVRAVGHRLVHGGSRFTAPVRLHPDIVTELANLVPLAPNHLPQAIACIEAVSRLAEDWVQVACFDTAFHRSMPAVARRLPLPENMRDTNVERFGFHGLSYEFITGELLERHDALDDERIIIAHLGNGASMVAVRGRQPVETTMGMTPAGGMMMSTRTGDLDPGVLVYLMRLHHLDASDVDTLVNARSGLLGVSGISGDMRDVHAAAITRRAAREAIELYCHLARKQLGGLVAVLGGLDRLVFTGGIGQHDAVVRAGICEGLEFLGIRIDETRNQDHHAVISTDDAQVTVMIMATNEELVIARHTLHHLDPHPHS